MGVGGKIRNFLLVAGVLSGLSCANKPGERETLPLSPEGASSLTVWLPAAGAGAARRPAVVICPGGGYRMLCDTYEGNDMARWLNARGIAAFVLRYRLAPENHKEQMLEDVYGALASVRAHAEAWAIDPKRVGVMGFSAGGHLAAMAGVLPSKDRADFMILVYPHVSMRRGLGHEHMRESFLGPGYAEADINLYSGEMRVTDDTPPAFVAHAKTDQVCSVEHSRRFVAAMREKGRPVEYFELPTGLHGLGCGKGPEWEAWLKALETWFQQPQQVFRRFQN